MSDHSECFTSGAKPTQWQEPLYSDFAGDPDMDELIEIFVGELTQRIETIKQAYAEQDLDHLRQLAHQIKGAGGGYGFMPITDSAAELEQQIKTQQAWDNIEQSVSELIDLCRRATSDNPK